MKYYIKTFGCQMNERDSEKVESILQENGFEKSSLKEADIIIVNSCAVREKSEKKIFSEIGRIKNINKKAKIVAMGCVAQIFSQKLSKISDVVLGTTSIYDFKQYFNKDLKDFKGIFVSNQIINPDYIFGHLKKPTAYIDIIYGCNNFCTYCVVPYTRLREISRSYKNILQEINNVVENGAKEVILLGQNVNSYNFDGINFIRLLEMINKIDKLKRIRFVTSHPKDFSEELARAMSQLDKVCEHLHLPLQSGSDRILKLMRRKYTFKDFAKKVEYFRKYNPKGSITSDIIVGFPMETENDFKQTVRALEEIKFDEIYSFKYSNRPFAKASLMPNQVSEEEKAQRLSFVQNLQLKISEQINKSYFGSIHEVLIESKAKISNQMQGRTRTNKIVNINNTYLSLQEGDIVNVKITKVNKHSFNGEICTN
ncbi:tRNA (N6-isopentenyl adenosine(37)-C2)-methylthiotransferase MiaB [Desulfurella sp.]|uniref:tRNA (N6-isopentenyl adenosine(37)-C2)-methylthiotransferase MiaB n=1 Tax=Desulfurella sp. TaxID=1962857 RepID=UPI0025BD3AA4|nr:tRNA (N6-isopentenyl adenosine(37)-C2)-methylthiotransferase MiaB [Desulfurella sp.]